MVRCYIASKCWAVLKSSATECNIPEYQDPRNVTHFQKGAALFLVCIDRQIWLLELTESLH